MDNNIKDENTSPIPIPGPISTITIIKSSIYLDNIVIRIYI